jgi:hypothetical protein
MRIWVLGLIMTVLAVTSANAQETPIESVISQQIQAFRADDFDRAFTFASPGIRGLFGSVENFQKMVTKGFPMVWRPTQVEFLALRVQDGRMLQRVRITDESGMVHVLDYAMLPTDDGWKINGVELLKKEGVNA